MLAILWYSDQVNYFLFITVRTIIRDQGSGTLGPSKSGWREEVVSQQYLRVADSQQFGLNNGRQPDEVYRGCGCGGHEGER